MIAWLIGLSCLALLLLTAVALDGVASRLSDWRGLNEGLTQRRHRAEFSLEGAQ
ncbi:hypothetical protein ACIBOV_06540 [Micromonospora chersina]|uniref:hypothetical protein n=1 Tax=Micromonospora chersina TaxID=47854 RepID=UPI0037874A0B